MSQSGGPGAPGQPPPGPPDWRSAPQPPQPPQQPASWQSAPLPPNPPNVPPPPPPSWSANLTSTAPVPGPAGFVYADVPNRVVAYIIDIIVLGLIGILTSAIIIGVFGAITVTTITTNGTSVDLNVGPFFALSIVNLVVGALYFVWLWSAQRGTLGMKVLGLQIGAEADGRSISMGQAFSRWLVIGIPGILAQFAGQVSSGIGLILSLIGIIWLIALLWSIAQSPTKQGYHDRYAKTIMVKAARRAA